MLRDGLKIFTIAAAAIVLTTGMAQADAKDKYRQNLRACIARQAACGVTKLSADDQSYLTTEIKGHALPADAIDSIVGVRMRSYNLSAGTVFMSDAELRSACSQDDDWFDKATACRVLVSKTGGASERASILTEEGLGEIYSGHTELASKTFREAIRDYPSSPEAQFGMGELLRAQGNPLDAMAQFKKAIDLDQTYAEPHAGIGYVLMEKGTLHGAEIEFNAALEINPTSKLALAGKEALAIANRKHAAEARLADGPNGTIIVGSGDTATTVPIEVASDLGLHSSPNALKAGDRLYNLLLINLPAVVAKLLGLPTPDVPLWIEQIKFFLSEHTRLISILASPIIFAAAVMIARKIVSRF